MWYGGRACLDSQSSTAEVDFVGQSVAVARQERGLGGDGDDNGTQGSSSLHAAVQKPR